MRNIANTYTLDPTTTVRQNNITKSCPPLSKDMTIIVDKGGHKRSSKVTVFSHIKAPVEVCFDLVTKQLEKAPRWDPTIRWVVPISRDYMGVGSKSQVTFDLAGSIEESTVTLHSFIPNKVLEWTSNHSTQLKEEWRFVRQSDGTLVIVTLSYKPHQGLLKYFNRWTRMNSQIQQAVYEMLRRLKMTAELPKPRYYLS